MVASYMDRWLSSTDLRRTTSVQMVGIKAKGARHKNNERCWCELLPSLGCDTGLDWAHRQDERQ